MHTGRRIYETLAGAANEALRCAVLVSPFIKCAAFSDIVGHLKSSVELTVVTRWRVDEVLAGVSDPETYLTYARRAPLDGEPSRKDSFRLLDSLHAKYYRFDDQVFVGSANLTSLGTGLSGNAVELLVPVPTSTESQQFERTVLERSGIVDQWTADYYLSLARNSAPDDSIDDVHLRSSPHPTETLFQSRTPDALWECYSQEPQISVATRDAALADLDALHIPPNLSREAFQSCVQAAVSSSLMVKGLRTFCSDPRRFGELKAWLKPRLSPLQDADLATQTMIRWVTFWLPNEFRIEVPNHSEVLWHVSIDEGS